MAVLLNLIPPGEKWTQIQLRWGQRRECPDAGSVSRLRTTVNPLNLPAGSSEKVLRPQLSKENYFLGGLSLSGGESLSGSSTCQMSLSLCNPKTPTWFDSDVPICPIQTTLKRALRQRRRTSMVSPGLVRKPTPSRRAPSLHRSTVYALCAKGLPLASMPFTVTRSDFATRGFLRVRFQKSGTGVLKVIPILDSLSE